jgi:hypothetical protein
MPSHSSGVRFSQSSAELRDSTILSQAVFNLSLYSEISISALIPKFVRFSLLIVNSNELLTESPTKPST